MFAEANYVGSNRTRAIAKVRPAHEIRSALPEPDDLSFLHSGLAQTCLPHSRPVSDSEPWMRSSGRFSLIISPGVVSSESEAKRALCRRALRIQGSPDPDLPPNRGCENETAHHLARPELGGILTLPRIVLSHGRQTWDDHLRAGAVPADRTMPLHVAVVIGDQAGPPRHHPEHSSRRRLNTMERTVRSERLGRHCGTERSFLRASAGTCSAAGQASFVPLV